jgi:hypothetical protein
MTVQRVSNIVIGAHEVTWGGTSLGFTEEGFQLSFNWDTIDRMAHELGTTPHEIIRIGFDVRITCNIKERSTAGLVAILSGTTPGGTVVDVNPTPAAMPTAEVKLLPINASDDSNAWTFWKASILPTGGPLMKVNEDQTWPIEIRALLKQDASDGFIQLVRYGIQSTTPVDYDPTA